MRLVFWLPAIFSVLSLIFAVWAQSPAAVAISSIATLIGIYNVIRFESTERYGR